MKKSIAFGIILLLISMCIIPSTATENLFSNRAMEVSDGTPDTPSQPSGNISGYICIDHNYSTSTTDPNGLNISYGWDWEGDLIVDEWTGWYESNETCTIAHNWSDPGDFNISVKAKNTLEDESNWSDPLSVTMLNHPPYAPSNPFPEDGAKYVPLNVTLCWVGGDPDSCDTVTYDVYFDDAFPLKKWECNHTENCWKPKYGLILYHTYYWQIVSWDNHGASTEGPVWQFSTDPWCPPTKPIISGPTRGKPGIEYNYTFTSIDPFGEDVYYWIVWGDESPAVEWDGPYSSGEPAVFSHTFVSQGDYTISAKAKNVYEIESDWGYLEVTVPKNKMLYNPLLLRLLERFPNAFPILKLLLGL